MYRTNFILSGYLLGKIFCTAAYITTALPYTPTRNFGFRAKQFEKYITIM